MKTPIAHRLALRVCGIRIARAAALLLACTAALGATAQSTPMRLTVEPEQVVRSERRTYGDAERREYGQAEERRTVDSTRRRSVTTAEPPRGAGNDTEREYADATRRNLQR